VFTLPRVPLPRRVLPVSGQSLCGFPTVGDYALDTLPPGATVGIRPDGQRVDPAAFKAACHHAARALGARVALFEPEHTPHTSYLYAVVELPGGRPVAVLCNRAYPFLAFSDEPDALYMTRRYVDEPTLAAAFAEVPPFQAIPASALSSPPGAVSLEGLPEREQEHVRYWLGYWRPPQAGDLLFNDWD
jgi:hypothetical protein